MTDQLDLDVLIVGGGPTGASLGLLLGRAGVRTQIIDKEAEIYPLPRAAHIDHEVARIFQEMGLAEEQSKTWRVAPRYDFLTKKGDILLRFDHMDRIGPGGWPVANMIHQPILEAGLRDAIADQDNVELVTRACYLSHRECGDHVEVEIETPSGIVTRTTRYLVGADGAKSPVREAAGIAFDDLNFDEPWLVVDVLVLDRSRLPDINLQICDPERPTTCVLMGEGRHRWEFMIKPDETPEKVLDDAFIADLLAPWNVEGAIEIERKAVYRFNAKVAEQWRKGRVLLVGDAAHQMPPFAGQGLCSGLRDAANLAWKLTAINDAATDTLLDTYQLEREPNVRAIISMAMMMGQTVCITDPAAAAQRDAAMIAARASGTSPDGSTAYPAIDNGCIMSRTPAAGTYFPQPVASSSQDLKLDDVLGAGACLISRSSPETYESSSTSVRIASLDSAELAPFRDQLDHWLAAHAADAVLVRPDRYVFGTGAPSAVVKAWATKLDLLPVDTSASHS